MQSTVPPSPERLSKPIRKMSLVRLVYVRFTAPNLDNSSLVLLGADMALGPALVQDLTARGFIVIASVATPEAIPELEKKGRGYVKALVLDPHDVSYFYLCD
jgi:hypothetical protein